MSEVNIPLRQQIVALNERSWCFKCGIHGGGHRVGCAGVWGSPSNQIFMTGVGWVDWQSWPS
jgi:hypothetical protein